MDDMFFDLIYCYDVVDLLGLVVVVSFVDFFVGLVVYVGLVIVRIWVVEGIEENFNLLF